MGSSVSLMIRGLLAIVLMVGFYLLALAIAGGLLYLPYAEVVYAHRIHPKLVIFCLLATGTILWAIMPRVDKFEAPGPQLQEGRFPDLFRELKAIASATQQTMPGEVYLVGDMNAWVAERGGLMGFGGRRVMGIGLPLLQLLSVSQFAGVLAHEFGHYYGGDTKLGPWIYKTRAAIGRTLAGLGDSMLQWPFRWYGKVFLWITLAISRRQEYTADSLAASVVGSKTMAEGLKKVHGGGLVFDQYWQNSIVPVLNSGFLPQFRVGFEKHLQAADKEQLVDKIAAEIIKTDKGSLYDTHPALKDRLGALEKLNAPAKSERSQPAISLLGPKVSDVENELWRFTIRADALPKFKPIRWDQVGHDVHVPFWKKILADHAAGLRGNKIGQLSDLLKDLPGLRLKLYKQDIALPGDDMDKRAVNLMQLGLAVALHDHGWTVQAEPGTTVICRLQDVELKPFALINDLKDGKMTREEWAALCEQHQLANLPIVA